MRLAGKVEKYYMDDLEDKIKSLNESVLLLCKQCEDLKVEVKRLYVDGRGMYYGPEEYSHGRDYNKL